MATTLAGGQSIAQYDVCVMRVGRLGSDCAPLYGANNGIITAALVDAEASPELRDFEDVEIENGCGQFLLSVTRQAKTKYRTITGTLGLFDYEMFELMFGGTLIYGAAGTDFANEVIGWGEPGPDAPDRNPISLEFIVRNAAQGIGSCQVPSSSADYPTYTGYIFPKVTLTLGARSFGKGGATVSFSGRAEANPNYRSGPFRDWDNTAGVGTFPAGSPMVIVGYDGLPTYGATTDAGYVTTPAVS